MQADDKNKKQSELFREFNSGNRYKSLDLPWTQAEFASLLEADPATVSRAVRRGILSRGGNCESWLRQWYKHQQAVAAGRTTTVELNLADERAKLAHAQREEIEIRIGEKRRELLPVNIFVDGVAMTLTSLKVRSLALPAWLKKNDPKFSQVQYGLADEAVREWLTELSGDQFPRDIRRQLEELYGGNENGNGEEPHDAKNGNHRPTTRRPGAETPKKARRDKKKKPA